MAKYMISANCSSEGMKGVLADGATSRRAAVEALAAAAKKSPAHRAPGT